ncbi:MAG: two-component system, OmpR family, phosphate regulon response regulator PhoB [Phycisphaerales bacterium]|jgi:CheY-like chemotaxis protein|nr:two-component system, OmpR family, phosphate regulon response regulator PhoB [Phycisphaerales bacterium]
MGTVLIVDDNVDTCKVLAAFLARGGHEAICTTSVPAAVLKLIDADRALPDLVITDLMMPGQSGIDLVREIRATKRTKELPVIVYSAVSEHRYVEQAMTAGATDYWLKGAILPSDLQMRIAAFLPNGVGWSAPIRHDPIHAF